MQLDIYPDRAFYCPGESVTLLVTITAVSNFTGTLAISITQLANELTVLKQEFEASTEAVFTTSVTWQPPETTPCGYGVDAQIRDQQGLVATTAVTAFDVLTHWTQAPRYGFLTDFRPERVDAGETAVWMAKYHLNGIQFYDWMYRHDQLMPPANGFVDPLGRPLSLATVTQLIDALHERNIAAMPYTAVYAASNAFHAEHPEWALFQEDDTPYAFEDFLMIMNMAPDAPWTRHILAQFADVLQRTRFDGIHLDQYGEPKAGFDNEGTPVDLAEAIPAFIDATKAVAAVENGRASAVIFNCVAVWPLADVAQTSQDAVYIEMWPPETGYHHLHKTIVKAQQLSDEKPVILATYIDPAWEHNVLLADAAIFASGGYHIELGEPGGMLSDPYFPKYGRMSPQQADRVRRYYDFAVRFENILSLDTQDATAQLDGRIEIDGYNVGSAGNGRSIWTLARHSDTVEVIHLINLLHSDNPGWYEQQTEDQRQLTDLTVQLRIKRPFRRLWCASPDGEQPAAQPLPFTEQDAGEYKIITFNIPALHYWSMIVLDSN